MFLCQLCPGWTGPTKLGQRVHIRSNLRSHCGLCGRSFAHGHLRLLHRLPGMCSGTLRSRNATLRAKLLRRDTQGSTESVPEVVESDKVGNVSQHVEPMDAEQSGREEYKCYTCGATLASLKSMGHHGSSFRACRTQQQKKANDEALREARGKGPDGSFACAKCGGSQKTAVLFKHHLYSSRSCGNISKIHRCDDCGQGFAMHSRLQAHMPSSLNCRREQSRKRVLAEAGLDASRIAALGLSCPKCAKAFKWPNDLGLHMKRTGACALRLRRNELAKQSAKRHDAGFQCLKCGQSLKTSSSLSYHLNFSASCGDRAGRYPCPKCGRAFAFRGELASHKARNCCAQLIRLRERYSSIKPDNTCAKCGITFSKRRNLTHHLSTSRSCGDQSSKLKCDGCHSTFAFPSYLKLHLSKGGCARATKIARNRAIAGEPLVEGLFRCADCDYSAPVAGIMRRHRQSSGCRLRRLRERNRRLVAAAESGVSNVQDSLPFPAPSADQIPSQIAPAEERTCPKCQRIMATVRRLKIHLLYSRLCGEKPRKAKTTKLTATAADTETASTNRRKNAVTKTRPACAKCGRSFGNAGRLRNHTQTSQNCGESSGKTFPCPKCGRVQRSPAALTDHLRSSRSCGFSAASCTCDRCGASFGKPSAVALHIGSRVACDRVLQRRRTLRRLSINDEINSLTSLGKAKRQWSCGKCGKTFAQIHRLSQHLDRVAEGTCGDGAGEVACDDCGHLTSPFYLKNHFASLRNACRRRQ